MMKKNIMKRKWSKIQRDPKSFFYDMYVKRFSQLKKYIPVKHSGNFSYTVVSAVYNVEKYLDEYFDSIVNQSLNFKKHIHIILVDDGSTDNSAQIIKKWQKKYPNNIHYYYKENGGQASARNLGLQYVKTDWVTFIDPDDFLNVDYFKNVDCVLSEDNSVCSVVCNIQMYRERNKSVTNAHPLKYRFNADVNKVNVKDLGKNINLSVAITFFDMRQIRKLNLQFSDKIKPSFEDARFIADYQLDLTGSVVFLKNSIYYYRKREDGSSTLDKAGQDYKRYTDIYQYGVIPMLKNYKVRYGNIPENIQITALYDFIWQLKILLNNPEKISFLTDEQRKTFYALCYELFDYIDEQQILRFGLADTWFFHKVGMLGYFKKAKPNSQICYIEEVDLAKKQILVAYYTHFDVLSQVMLDGQEIVPVHQKDTANYLNEELFVWEKRMWLPFDNEKQVLSIKLDRSLTEIKFGKKATKNAVVVDILKEFSSPKYQNDGSWLFMDRETKADDNAEHLYRYIQTHHPEQKCYFALNRDSVDWDRLADDGFNLVAFGKSDFELRLATSSKIISSHIDAHIHNYFGDLYAGTKQFVFLQHGVTKDNLSRWLNGKKYVAGFITTTKDEYQSIAIGERYKFGEKETVLTGFPRHDELYRKNQANKPSKTILIMPTWRSYLMGETVGKGANTRSLNLDLLNSNYATHWLSFLRSEKLQQLVKEYGYKVIFAPHANIEPYLPHMNLPTYLQIWRSSQTDESMQDLFVRASMMITDYSSVAFEMAYIGKPTLYYQFDKDEFFSGSHSYQKGYFEYEQHGFGAVSYDEQTLLNDLADLLKNGVAEEYQYRIDNTFAYQDDQNSERVYQAIKALDEPSDNLVNTAILTQMLDSAYEHQAWDLVVSRAKLLLEHEPDNERAQSLLVQGLTHAKQWQQAKEMLSLAPIAQFAKENIQVSYWLGDWQGVVSAYQNLVEPDFVESYQYLQALELLGEMEKAKILADGLSTLTLTDGQKLAINLHTLMLNGEYYAVIDLKEQAEILSVNDLKILKTELIFAKAHRMLDEYDLAHAELVAFEKHTRNDFMCRLEIANLAFDRTYYGKCIGQFETLIKSGYVLQSLEQTTYLNAVFLAGQYDKYVEIFKDVESQIIAPNQSFRVDYIRQDWQSVTERYYQIAPDFVDMMLYLQALIKLGKTPIAKALLNSTKHLKDDERLLVDLVLFDLNQQYQAITDLFQQVQNINSTYQRLFKIQLIFAKAHRMLGAYDDAHAQLVEFEKHTGGDVDCRREIAKLAFARDNYGKCVDQFEKLIQSGYALDPSEQERYLQAVYLARDFTKYEQLFAESDMTKHDDEAKIAYIKSLVNQQKWQEALTAADELSISAQPELAYELTLAKYRLGGVEEVYRPDIRLSTQDSYEYWQLISEIAFLMDDRELEKYCYRGMISIYPNKDKQANMDKLAGLR